MMFVRWARAALALCVPCAMGALLASCGGGHTIGYLYVASNGQSASPAGTLYSYDINSEVGGITAITNTSANATSATAAITVQSGAYLYIASQNGISEFSVSKDSGATKAGPVVQTPGASAVAMASDLAGKFLFVVDTYGAGFSAANPGPGAVNVYSIGSGGALSLVGAYATDVSPAGVAVLPNATAVYVTATTATGGLVDQFSVGSNGTLTSQGAANCGVQPIAITAEPTNRFLYAADYAQNQVYAYVVGADFTLTQVISSPFATIGLGPDAITVEPRGEYVYVANYRSSTVTAFGLSRATGGLAELGVVTTGTGPKAIAVDPLQATYVYTADYLNNSVTAFKLAGTTGLLTAVQDSPFDDVGQHPSAVAIAPNGTTPIPGTP